LIRYFWILLFCCSYSGAIAQTAVVLDGENDSLSIVVVDSVDVQTDSLALSGADSTATTVDNILSTALQLEGITYHFGSRMPENGFDCSGFIHYVFTTNGVHVPRTTRGWGSEGRTVPIDEARRGDLILFTGTNASIRSPGHMGLVISEPGEPLVFIHSSSSRKHYGVTRTVYDESGYPKRFLRIIRYLE